MLFHVQYQPTLHKGKAVIFLRFERNDILNARVKKLETARWSQSRKSWYVEDTAEYREKFGLQPATKPQDYNAIAARPAPTSTGIQTPPQQVMNSAEKKQSALLNISPVNNLQLQNFVQQLILKGYSPSTIKTYRNEFTIFLTTLKMVDVSRLTTQRVKDYLAYCHTTLKLTENTIHSRMNAIKFYYEQVLGREKFFWEIPRPKKAYILPKVLGEDELRKLFNSITYKKHKAILFTAYSAGLRVSEVVRLQLKHIDSGRMQLFIEKSKGKKDRYVMLSPVLLDILRNYIKTAQPRPVKYLFEGQEPGQPYTSRSAQRIFQMAKEKAGITKELGFHTLRHSFATHLLEKGTDVKYIKDLLGHFDIRTTERYLHVKKDILINIVSPLDDLWKKGDI